MSKIVPNSFQVPNLYTDRLMPLLTDTEFRILIYMTRRILGFHKREDRISLSQFTDGLIHGETGTQLDYGAGVSKESARIALEKLTVFNVIVMTKPHDRTKNLPAEWSLQLDDALIDWSSLEERKRNLDQAGKDRAAKRRANKEDPIPAASTGPFGPNAVLTVSTGLSQPLVQGYPNR